MEINSTADRNNEQSAMERRNTQLASAQIDAVQDVTYDNALHAEIQGDRSMIIASDGKEENDLLFSHPAPGMGHCRGR